MVNKVEFFLFPYVVLTIKSDAKFVDIQLLHSLFYVPINCRFLTMSK